MKRAIGCSVFGLCLSLFLIGCLDLETARIRLDFANNTGEAVYFNIVSDAMNEEYIEDDFKSLLEIAYDKEDDPEGGDTQLRELYAEEGHLSGRIKFIITDKEKILETFNIKRGPGDKYVMDLTDNTAYVGGNGALVDSGSGRQVVWDGKSPVIEAEIRYDSKGREFANLLPFWEKWQAWDSQTGPDSLELLTGHLGDAIEPSKEEYIIDYCPDATCYSFSSGLMSPGARNRLADFAYIYLFNISNDVSLEAFKAYGGGQMAEIVSRNMRDCPDEGEEETARCALRNLAMTYKIELKSIIYEEMEKKETPVDIWTELSRTEK